MKKEGETLPQIQKNMATLEKKAELESLINESEKALKDYVISKGRSYPLDEWVTIKEYCKRFGIENTQTVTNWIKRGVITSQDIVVLVDLNDIRLIRAIPYRG